MVMPRTAIAILVAEVKSGCRIWLSTDNKKIPIFGLKKAIRKPSAKPFL